MARIKAIDTRSVERMMFVKDFGQRNLSPCEIIFATGDAQDGLVKLAKDPKPEVDEAIDAFHVTFPLPSELGKRLRGWIKEVDDRGIERLNILELKAD